MRGQAGWPRTAGSNIRADGGRTWRTQVRLPEAGLWRGEAWIRVTGVAGWALFTLGQGFASQEPYILYRTCDTGRNWRPVLTGSGTFLPGIDRPPGTSLGPGGYPVALAVLGSTQAWLAMFDPPNNRLVVFHTGDGLGWTAGPTVDLGSNPPADYSHLAALSFPDDQQGFLATSAGGRGILKRLVRAAGASAW